MKKVLLLTLLLALFILAVTGCEILDSLLGDTADDHEHVGGEASCIAPAVCDVCGNAYGDVAEHSYVEATCEEAKHCAICAITEGDPLGHDYSDATCEEARKCNTCFKTDGEALGHEYMRASCNEPEICTVCGKTRGEVFNHRFIDATCTTPKTCAVCDYTVGEAIGHKLTDATCMTPKTCTICGYAAGDALGHSYTSDYLFDDDKHWLECTLCGYKDHEGEHTGGVASGNERAQCEICSAYYGDEPVVIDWAIEALTPYDGSTFCLANSRIMSWYETFSFKSTDTNSYMTGDDVFVPDVPLFTWTVGAPAHYYKVYVSDSSDFSSYKCYLTSSSELTVEHLYTGTTYYWYVDAVFASYTVRSEVFSFTTQRTPRTVNIDGVSNSRDIGGYITIDGLKIKEGMVYRSAKLDDITELGEYTLLYELGVKTDLDLRGDRNDYYKNATHPVEELNHIVVACPWYSAGSNHIWMDDYNKAEFAKAVKVFADPNNYPIIFHCSLGRDRTGTLAMVLEGLLGLDENTLMMEYELSAFSYWGAYNANFNDGLRNDMHNTYLYISNNYDGNSFSEKVEDFLLDIGVTAEEIASIKDIMLEEVV